MISGNLGCREIRSQTSGEKKGCGR
jgi:hypothetical protein